MAALSRSRTDQSAGPVWRMIAQIKAARSGDAGYSWMSQLGPRFAVCALDTRSSRTRERIVPEKLLAALTRRIAALPHKVEHLLFVSAVPIEYPEVGALETFMEAGEGNNIFTKTGAPLPPPCPRTRATAAKLGKRSAL